MRVRLQQNCGAAEIDTIRRLLAERGAPTRVVGTTIVVVSQSAEASETLASVPGVVSVEPIGTPYKLVARAVRPEGTRVRIGNVEIGGQEFVVAAGPCAVENRTQMIETAIRVAEAGARLLRGGAFKPRTSPYSFQGLGEEGLRLLSQAGRQTGLPTITEVLSAEHVPLVSAYADALQVGTRNMQNFALLKALGTAGKPVVLKRGFSSTVEELLMAAEYIALHGNLDIIICERGIRTFETATRNTLDLAAVAILRQATHLPVIVDPSHGTGRRDLVGPLSKAAVAVGTDGLMVEVHPDPDLALSDGPQSVTPHQFTAIMRDLAGYVALQGRSFAVTSEWQPGERIIGTHRQRTEQL